MGDMGRSSRKRRFWMLPKYALRVFASGKPKLQKSIWRLTGWPLWLVNENGRCWPAGAEKECADGLEAWGSGLLTGQDGNKDAACWKMCTSYFRVWKIRAYFFCLLAEFCSAAFGSRCGIPWKDQTEEIKKSGKILLQWRKIRHTVYIRNEEDFRWTII